MREPLAARRAIWKEAKKLVQKGPTKKGAAPTLVMPDVFPRDVQADHYLQLPALQFSDGRVPLYIGVRGDDCDDIRDNLNRGWVAEFEKEALATPSKCLNQTPARGNQFNLGKSTMATDIVDLPLVTVPKQLQEELGTKKDDCTISFPYPLKHHKHANSKRFEEMVGEAVVLLCKLFEKKWPILYHLQKNSIHPDDRWPQSYTKTLGKTKVPHSCFDKVNVNRNLGTKFHHDKGNVSGTLCALLMFGDYTGGDQLLMNGVNDTVIRIKNQAYDVCFAQFDGLFHSNEEPLEGTRYAIIPYSNKGLADYYKVERFFKGITTGRLQAAGPSDPEMAGEFHAKQLVSILAKHLCENTKQLLNGFKEDTPTLFLALDVMELTTKVEALVAHWGTVSEQDLAVLSYLVSAFNLELFEHVTRHCQSGLNVESIVSLLVECEQKHSARRGPATGTDRFRNQGFAERLNLLRQLHTNAELWAKPCSMGPWISKAAKNKELKGMGKFMAMVTARVMVFRDYFVTHQEEVRSINRFNMKVLSACINDNRSLPCWVTGKGGACL